MGPLFPGLPQDVIAEILALIGDAPAGIVTILEGYPRLSQLDPANYNDATVAEAEDIVIVDGVRTPEKVKNLACLATVYVMISRGLLHEDDKYIDYYYPDPRKTGGETNGAEQKNLVGRIGQQVALDVQAVKESLVAGRPTILRGMGGPLVQHFILATGYVEPPTGPPLIVAHDPWPAVGETGGRVILLHVSDEGLKHPNLPLTFTHMRQVE